MNILVLVVCKRLMWICSNYDRTIDILYIYSLFTVFLFVHCYTARSVLQHQLTSLLQQDNEAETVFSVLHLSATIIEIKNIPATTPLPKFDIYSNTNLVISELVIEVSPPKLPTAALASSVIRLQLTPPLFTNIIKESLVFTTIFSRKIPFIGDVQI